MNVKDEEVEWTHTDKKTDYGVRTEEEAVETVTKEQEKALSNKINDDDDLYLILSLIHIWMPLPSASYRRPTAPRWSPMM